MSRASNLSRIVEERNLPQKRLLVHRFTADMIENERALRRHVGVALTMNVDGFGTAAQKRAGRSTVSSPAGEVIAIAASSSSIARTPT